LSVIPDFWIFLILTKKTVFPYVFYRFFKQNKKKFEKNFSKKALKNFSFNNSALTFKRDFSSGFGNLQILEKLSRFCPGFFLILGF